MRDKGVSRTISNECIGYRNGGTYQVQMHYFTTRKRLIAALLTTGESNLKMPEVSYHRRVEMGLPGVVSLALAN
jgi:hypothetical protein